ncbi:hypothetical protein CEXT_13271 [Caerostris extrusa]|uniref:Uncharacterized protein n=1 Tax=Caerostris extrusa TaxID=172846 RepID=A0AAV4P363_CAEEX|nr:hypothetical protein CEXT_13271 [Caerostris extrusa]
MRRILEDTRFPLINFKPSQFKSQTGTDQMNRCQKNLQEKSPFSSRRRFNSIASSERMEPNAEEIAVNEGGGKKKRKKNNHQLGSILSCFICRCGNRLKGLFIRVKRRR